MDLGASETLLAEFQRRSRRFRRRVRRHDRPVNNDAGAAEPVPLGEVFNEAIDAAAVVGPDVDGGEDVQAGDDSDTWSHDRIDRGREMERLEQILLRENHEFHLHC